MSRIVEEWHEKHSNEVEHLIWLSQYPEFKIIEHLRSVLIDSSRTSLKVLEGILTQEWLNSFVNNSHLERINISENEAVIVAKSGSTPYKILIILL